MMIDALKAENAILSKREELYAKNMVVDAAIGEQIYQAVCTACHAFDKVVLGPAHGKTLPKYLNDPEALVEFLKSPTKVDPAFPAMPNPGLTTFKIKSVVKYLMGTMGKEWPEGSDSKEETTEKKDEADNKDGAAGEESKAEGH